MRFGNAIRLFAIIGVMLAGMALPGTATAQIAVEFSVGFAPPPLPVYEQPICPGEGYIWTPGYWAWDDEDQDYYWVPGTWVLAPEVGFLWTPGYWGWGGEAYVFHVGYWGPVVGFYGGIDYGWGYTGRGYYGGRWDHDHFYYNREVNHIDERVIRNVYNVHVENNVNITRVSYNGGSGGVAVRPTAQEEAVARERHIGPVSAQNQHIQQARSNRELHASENRGKPPIAATPRPAAFSGSGVVAARAGGNYNPPPNRGGNRSATAGNRPGNDNRAANENRPPNASNNPNRPPNATARAETNNRPTYSHSNEVPRHAAPQADANTNQKYQQQQERLAQKQNQEHQRLQQQQEQQHQRVQQQSANAARQQQTAQRQQQMEQRQQQMEQRHQQQTQQMEQRHQQQTQQLQQRQQPRQQAPPPPPSHQQGQEKKPPH